MRRTWEQSTESHNLVWLVLRLCHATHSTAIASSPILAPAFLDENTKNEMFLLMLKHPAAPTMANLGSRHQNSVLSPSYLRRIICKTVTRPNTINCKVIGSCCWHKLVQWVYIIIVWRRAGQASAQSLWFHLINKSSWRQSWLLLTLTHSTDWWLSSHLSLLIRILYLVTALAWLIRAKIYLQSWLLQSFFSRYIIRRGELFVLRYLIGPAISLSSTSIHKFPT